MTRVLGLEVAGEVDDGSQADRAAEWTCRSGPHPVQDSPRPYDGISVLGSEASKVVQDGFVIDQFEAGGSPASEVAVDRDAQHDTTSGHGWATWASSARSTLA